MKRTRTKTPLPFVYRICWYPDATCLEGGCGWCNGSRPRTLMQITQWAQTAGKVMSRYTDVEKDAMEALQYGLDHTGPGKRIWVD